MRIRKNRRAKRNRQGFLLLEAILTMVIVTVGMTVSIYALIQAYHATAFCRDYTSAIWQAENKMTELFARGTVDRSSATEGDLNGTPYHFELQVEKLPDQKKITLYESTLTLSWIAGKNNKGISVLTYLPATPEDVKSP